MLWFIQHYLWDLGLAPRLSARTSIDAWARGYLPVNELFAAAVVDELRDGAATTARDALAHAARLPPVLRRARWCAPPCPAPSCSSSCTSPGRRATAGWCCPGAARAVFEGLLGNDIVAFHTDHYVRNFLHGCADLLDLRVDLERRSVTVDGREVWVRAYPVSIDPAALRRRRHGERVAASRAPAAASAAASYLLLRVDRLDPSKNIIRGFIAFDRFLEMHPEFTERITFLALLQPSREDVEEYTSLPRARDAHRGADQHQARQHGLDAHRPAHPGRLPPDPGRLPALRRAAGERHLRRHEPGGQGRARGQRARRRADPQREHRRLRGARRLRAEREPLRHRGPGRGDPRGAHHGRRRAARPRRGPARAWWTPTAWRSGWRASWPTSRPSWRARRSRPRAEPAACRRLSPRPQACG